MKSKAGYIFLFVIILFSIFAYNKITIFSIQPVGALPDGATVVMWRKGDMRFFESPDAICLRKVGSVSLMCRAMAMGSIGENPEIIMRLPYIEKAYLLSTDGKKFEK
ncbi:hypothetical protein [Pectobacterium betavasculorum]|uniref:Uncharacterized protein n=1 Tax=Pectobacterium betavasculorum TaxID=55207 RepID=A0ABR4V0Q8_9GAMM|nr:hypothetical protein [Pectobacterium betavasculorum]KFX20807.1 hypothetical protein JV35_06295 [Pectobacterium betavasculorum]